jgi:hypothetical protein
VAELFQELTDFRSLQCNGYAGCELSAGCNSKDATYLFKGNKGGGGNGLQIMHYSRSLEKFSLKSRTWVTASGEGGAKSNNYHLGHFLDRQIGTHFDNRAAMRYHAVLIYMI